MNASDYFYRDKAGREIGPLSLDTLAKFRLAGVVDNQTQVRVSDSTEWKALQEIFPNLPGSSSSTVQPSGKIPYSDSSPIKWALVLVVALGVIMSVVRKKDSTPVSKAERAGNSVPIFR